MKNELKRRHCNLNLEITANEFTAISGEISALIQEMQLHTQLYCYESQIEIVKLKQ